MIMQLLPTWTQDSAETGDSWARQFRFIKLRTHTCSKAPSDHESSNIQEFSYRTFKQHANSRNNSNVNGSVCLQWTYVFSKGPVFPWDYSSWGKIKHPQRQVGNQHRIAEATRKSGIQLKESRRQLFSTIWSWVIKCFNIWTTGCLTQHKKYMCSSKAPLHVLQCGTEMFCRSRWLRWPSWCCRRHLLLWGACRKAWTQCV